MDTTPKKTSGWLISLFHKKEGSIGMWFMEGSDPSTDKEIFTRFHSIHDYVKNINDGEWALGVQEVKILPSIDSLYQRVAFLLESMDTMREMR